MKKKVEKNKFRFLAISNRLAYTLITICLILLLGIGVYAYGGATPPIMGHSAGEFTWPTCGANEVLASMNGVVSCVTPLDKRLTIASNRKLCYDAPASCAATTSEPCGWSYRIEGVRCSEQYDASYATTCYYWCNENRPLNSCNGDTTGCSGGTTSPGVVTADGGCDVLYQDGTGDDIICSCYSNNYQQEHVVPAGERCI